MQLLKTLPQQKDHPQPWYFCYFLIRPLPPVHKMGPAIEKVAFAPAGSFFHPFTNSNYKQMGFHGCCVSSLSRTMQILDGMLGQRGNKGTDQKCLLVSGFSNLAASPLFVPSIIQKTVQLLHSI